MILKYEPSSKPLHISAKQLFSILTRDATGEPPTDDAEREWLRMERKREARYQMVERAQVPLANPQPQILLNPNS